MASKKKVRFLGLAQIYLFLRNFWHITCLFDTRYQMSISEDGVRGQTKSI